MKKTLIILLAFTLFAALVACGNNSTNPQTDESTQTAEIKDKNTILSTKNLSVDGICIDDSYIDKDNESLKLVYFFYTVKATDVNLQVDSK